MAVPQVVAPSARAAMAPFAAAFWGDPTAELKVVGVTGTNGKTTTAYLIREILEAAGMPDRAAGDGEAGRRRARRSRSNGPRRRRSTCRRRFRAMIDGGDRACAMEVSSHALALHRADAIHFDVADLHQPDPGPPRLPRRHGGLLRGQADAVRRARPRRADRQRRRPLRPPPGRGIRLPSPSPPRAPTPTTRATRVRRRGATSRCCGPKLHRVEFRPATPRCDCGRACRGASTSPTRSGRSRRPRRSASTREATAAGLAGGGAGAGPLRADRRGPAVRRPRRLRPHPRLDRERAAGGAAADRRPADRRLRLPAATATRPSGR